MTDDGGISFDDFLDALDSNDFVLAATILRRLPSLGRPELDLVADLFDPTLPWTPSNRFKLERVQRKGGNPRDPLRLHARNTIIYRAVARLVKGGMKTEAAIAEVMDKTGLGRSTVYDAYKAGMKHSDH